MSFFAALRRRWRRHDEELAERAYGEGAAAERLEEHAEVMNTGLLGANVESNLGSALTADREVADAEQSAEALEHEEPA